MQALRFLTVIGLASLVASCSTPGEVRAKPPSLEVASQKSTKDVAGCIGDKWEQVGRGTSLSFRPTRSGYSLVAEDNMIGFYGKDTAFVVDVDETKHGSASRLYSNMFRASDLDLLSRIIRDCQ